MKTTNNLIALSPFPDSHIKTEMKDNFIMAQQKVSLQEMTVVLDADGYRLGDVVYVKGDLYKQNWAKEVYEIGSSKFILCPQQYILIKNENHHT